MEKADSKTATKKSRFLFPMHDFTRNLLTEWRKLQLPFSGETFIVAVSGGADSVSLLLALHELRNRKKLNLRFVAAHFNHDLRAEESEKDEEFVKHLASNLQFELAVKKEKIESGGNLEQSSRLARYEFLRETADNLRAFSVLTAHTLNDQAETFLLNLIRGSGLEGLGAMKVIRNLEIETQTDSAEQSKIQNPKSKIQLVRPLLRWAKREDTENFCLLNEIDFRLDAMNEDLAFKRVRIRKVLLPMLKDFNPQIVENLAKTAFLLQEDHKAIKELTALRNFEQKTNVEETEENLKLKDLKNLLPSMRQYILREWLENRRGNLRSLDKKHFEAIENLISSRKSGKIVELPNGETVSKENGNLIFIKIKG